MKKLIIIQTVIPDYRLAVFEAIQNELGDAFALYGGERYFEVSVVSAKNNLSSKARNHFILDRRFLFQTGIWHLLFSKATLVLEMNPRVLSNWLFLVLRRLTNRRTVLWGHAWPRAGKGSKSDSLRNAMRKLATAIVVYTKTQKRELQGAMPSKRIYAAPNALISKEKMGVDATNEIPKHLIYVGRLTATKKPYFLVKAFHDVLPYLPEDMNLIIVGEGEERLKLDAYIEKHSLKNRIHLKGHISSYEELKRLYAQSFFSVSPGYVGLSITQSFGFGVPMLISRTENHSPEIEAATEGENAVFFETDKEVSFRESLLAIHKSNEDWMIKRESIVAFCKEEYSVEAMAGVFINLANDYVG